MSERSKERRRLAQQQLRARREQAEQQLHEKHEAAEQTSKLHVLRQLLHQTLLSVTTATREAFEHAVEDKTITNAYLVHLNRSGDKEYSGIAASILHQRKYVEKSYDGDITYKGQYAGAFTTWDNVASQKLHIDGDFALMHATVKGENMFNKARFTGNSILLGANITCENFANNSVVHGHGFCAHTKVNVKNGCMVLSKVVGSGCFESSNIHGKNIFNAIRIKGDYFAKKASLVGQSVFNADYVTMLGQRNYVRGCYIEGERSLWECTIKTDGGFKLAKVIGNAFANYCKITASSSLFKGSEIIGVDFAHNSNIEGKEMGAKFYTKQNIVFNGKQNHDTADVGTSVILFVIMAVPLSGLFFSILVEGIIRMNHGGGREGGLIAMTLITLFILAIFNGTLYGYIRSKFMARNYKRKQL